MAEEQTAAPEEISGQGSARETATADVALTPAEQAAIDYASADRSPYGRKWAKKELAWTPTRVDDLGDGVTRVTLTYRPAGPFHGRVGEERLEIAATGELVGREQVHPPQEAFPWALALLAVLSGVAAVVLVPFILTSDTRGGDPLYVAGRILWMRVAKPELTPRVHFTGTDLQGQPRQFEIAPEHEGTELAVLKVSLINQKTNAVVVLIDEDAARLLSTDGVNFSPINTVDRSQSIDAIDPDYFYPGFVPMWRTVDIKSGEQVTGMLVFEVPAGTKFKEFRWNASDSMVVRF